jgi:hypothetical protein
MMDEQEEKAGPLWVVLGILMLPFLAIWWLIRALIGFWAFILVIGLILLGLQAVGILNLDDSSKPTADSRSCPGYNFVRSLKGKDQINTFAAVGPKEGWKCEYSIDNENATVRFKANGLEAEIEGYESVAYYATKRELRADGFSFR